MSLDDGSGGPIAITTSTVRAMIQDQFPQWSQLPLKSIKSTGLVNAVYRLGDELSVRVPLRPSLSSDAVRREQVKLSLLEPYLPVPVPRVVAVGSPSDIFPGEWSIHRWVRGVTPSPEALVNPYELAADLASFVKAFRQVNFQDRPPAYLGERRTRASMNSVDEVTRQTIADLDGVIDARLALLSWEESLAATYNGREMWVHSDLKPNNLLVSREGRLAGVIDFETCGVGDPACDLFPAWFLLPTGPRETFRRLLGDDDATWLRGRGRVLSQALGYMRDYRSTNAELAECGRHAVDAVLVSSQ